MACALIVVFIPLLVKYYFSIDLLLIEEDRSFVINIEDPVPWPDILQYQYTPWYKFWREVVQQTNSRYQLVRLFNNLFPSIEGFRHRFYSEAYVHSKEFNSSLFEEEKHMGWPDSSFERWTSSVNTSRRDFDALMGARLVLHKLWKFQHPLNCDNKKYGFINREMSNTTGFGAALGVLSNHFSLIYKQDRIAIWDPVYEYGNWMKGDFCNGVNNYLCFFEPLSNCTPSIENENRHQYDVTYTIDRNWQICPENIKSILRSSLVAHELDYWYWHVISLVYMLRLNERTTAAVNKFIAENCVENLDEYDVGLHIRHTDKYEEATLVQTRDYMWPLETLRMLVNKTESNFSVFISTDDAEVLNWFKENTKYRIGYLRNRREDRDAVSRLRRDYHAMIFGMADLMMQQRATASIGTYESNWYKLILTLRSTVASRASGYDLEIGSGGWLSASHGHRFLCMITMNHDTRYLVKSKMRR